MNWENLAKAGYEEYYKQMRQAGDTRIFQWDSLPLGRRMAWIAATKEICDLYGKAVTA